MSPVCILLDQLVPDDELPTSAFNMSACCTTANVLRGKIYNRVHFSEAKQCSYKSPILSLCPMHREITARMSILLSQPMCQKPSLPLHLTKMLAVVAGALHMTYVASWKEHAAYKNIQGLPLFESLPHLV